LKRNLPKAERFETVSTSEAAQLASEQPEAAAIAGPQAAKIYGLKIAKKGLAKVDEYTTRFCVISTKPTAKNKPTHAALCFGLKHRPGALVVALSILAKHRLNLTRIISRPLSSRTGKFNPDTYLFWVDVDMRIGENIFNSAVRELRLNTTFLDILGSYFIRTEC
jgi:chorismate mutase/prephenate dehydratase